MSYLDYVLSTQSRLIGDLATGKVKLPAVLDTQPFEGIGFPPAFIPLWYSPGPSYYGIWKHWLNERSPAFVHVSLPRRCAVDELAATEEQLVQRILLTELASSCGELDEEIRDFATGCGIGAEEMSLILEVFRKTGDWPQGFTSLPAFRANAPSDCFPDGIGYQGQFPTLNSPVDAGSLRRICGLEIPEEATARFNALEARPPWLVAKRQAPVFADLMAQGDLAGAWMCLNSPGWHYSEIRQALPRLVERAGDVSLAEIAECWLELDHERGVIGY